MRRFTFLAMASACLGLIVHESIRPQIGETKEPAAISERVRTLTDRLDMSLPESEDLLGTTQFCLGRRFHRGRGSYQVPLDRVRDPISCPSNGAIVLQDFYSYGTYGNSALAAYGYVMNPINHKTYLATTQQQAPSWKVKFSGVDTITSQYAGLEVEIDDSPTSFTYRQIKIDTANNPNAVDCGSYGCPSPRCLVRRPLVPPYGFENVDVQHTQGTATFTVTANYTEGPGPVLRPDRVHGLMVLVGATQDGNQTDIVTCDLQQELLRRVHGVKPNPRTGFFTHTFTAPDDWVNRRGSKVKIFLRKHDHHDYDPPYWNSGEIGI